MLRPSVGKVFAAVLLAAGLPAAAQAGDVRIGIGLGFPVYPRYYYPYHPYYYYPPPVVIAPAPPPVTVVQPAAPPVTVVQPAPAQAAVPLPPDGSQTTLPPPAPVVAAGPDVQAYLGRLRDPDERVRADAALQLGRMQAPQAVEPLSALLASDRSPAVRDAAARGLGLIGTPNTLPALQRAAQADEDREVRNSARFAADVVRDRLRR
jgi:hypothetical protein